MASLNLSLFRNCLAAYVIVQSDSVTLTLTNIRTTLIYFPFDFTVYTRSQSGGGCWHAEDILQARES